MVIVKKTNEHLHGPDMMAVSCLETKAGIKRKAQETQDSTHHIMGEHLMIITQGSATKLPKIESIKRTIRRQRNVANNVHPQPTSLDLVLPVEYQHTNKGDHSL